MNYRMLSQFLCDAGFAYEALYIEEFGRARALTDLMAARYSQSEWCADSGEP